ncbi:MAG: hypothetical protein KJ804_06340 [Proteobacteria bacterium]|nr:hypothetical protein [Pseudomonadota bacterium]MBU1057923.1 hypothetical protein [Pseudomonadota bacterium]
MVFNDIVKQAKEKPTIDWDAYCEWNIMCSGSLWADSESKPGLWKCSCGGLNASVIGERYGKCKDCGLVYIASSE